MRGIDPGIPEQTYDVVIVGGGGAGLAAAIEARTLGRNVLLLEVPDAFRWLIGAVVPALSCNRWRGHTDFAGRRNA